MRISFSFCLLLFFLLGATHSDAATPAERYATCSEKVRSDAQGALSYAKQWYKETKHSSAQHCMALAHYALKEYSDAAQLLEKLGEPLKQKNLTLWRDIIVQTARSWQQARQTHRAIATLNRATLFITQKATENKEHATIAISILQERGALYEASRKPLDALQDYDHALTLNRNAHTVRLRRARLLLSLNEDRLAQDDAHYVQTSGSATNAQKQEAATLLK